jgi:predicted dehydrogenase
MKEKNPRRKFIANSATVLAGLTMAMMPEKLFGNNRTSRPVESSSVASVTKAEGTIRFSVIGLNHVHIYGMAEALIRNGAVLVSYYGKETDLVDAFAKRYPQAKLARSEKEILEDNTIQLVASASIPVDRAPLGIEVMKHGKDFLADKPGIISLQQLVQVKKVQKETKRIYSIMYSERFENKSTVKAGELVKAGAIGKVIQTIGMGPHRMNTKTRPAWFFDKKYYGGIICDIGSHQVDQFLFFTGSTKGEVVASQAGNVHHPEYPAFEDFGDMMLRGNNGTGYVRVDWFTPDGLDSWGDGRLTILGTDGYIELRKNIDIGGHAGTNHLFLVDGKETRYFDCNNDPLPFGAQLINDVLNRTETAMTQEHCFLATELALKAQKGALRI